MQTSNRYLWAWRRARDQNPECASIASSLLLHLALILPQKFLWWKASGRVCSALLNVFLEVLVCCNSLANSSITVFFHEKLLLECTHPFREP